MQVAQGLGRVRRALRGGACDGSPERNGIEPPKHHACNALERQRADEIERTVEQQADHREHGQHGQRIQGSGWPSRDRRAAS